MKEEPDEDLSKLTMKELIARSSLGSPEALEFRRLTPEWVAVRIMYGAGYLTRDQMIDRNVEYLRRLLQLDTPEPQ